MSQSVLETKTSFPDVLTNLSLNESTFNSHVMKGEILKYLVVLPVGLALVVMT